MHPNLRYIGNHPKCKPSNHQGIYPWRHGPSRLQAWPKSTIEMSSSIGSLHGRTAQGHEQNIWRIVFEVKPLMGESQPISGPQDPLPLAMESWDHAFLEALTLNSGAKETIQSGDEFIIARNSQTTTPHTTWFCIFSMLRLACTCTSWSELLFARWWVMLDFFITNDFHVFPCARPADRRWSNYCLPTPSDFTRMARLWLNSSKPNLPW